jgi:hypothetical protein
VGAEHNLKFEAVSIGEFKRSASNGADRFVYRLTREKPPAGASLRGFGALAFVERAEGSDPKRWANGGFAALLSRAL